MLSGLLITLDILVCLALIGVVLMQRSEGGAFGMGGGPTGLVTARGAGDLLTRTTWILFGAFLIISLSLTLLGAHDRATSSIIDKLKLQRANTSELNQTVAPPPASNDLSAPAPASTPEPNQLLNQPVPSAPPTTAPAPVATVPNLGAQPAEKPRPAHAAPKPATAAAPSEAPPPPVLEAPAPKPAPSSAPASGTP